MGLSSDRQTRRMDEVRNAPDGPGESDLVRVVLFGRAGGCARARPGPMQKIRSIDGASPRDCCLNGALHIDRLARSLEASMKFGDDRFLNASAQRIMDALLDGVTVYDRNGVLVWVNKKACEILGVLREDILGLNVSEIATLSTVESIQTDKFGANSLNSSNLRCNYREITSYGTPGYMVFKNGKRMLYSGNLIGNSDGSLEYAVFTIRDTVALDEARKRIVELEKLTNLYRDQLDVLHPAKHSHSVVYASTSMQRILERASKVARMDSTVLITGETGVGKNLLATYLHRMSGRAQGPLIHVNCACLPESLIEAELFGYVEGSFSGASRKGRRGLIEIAEGGTLFLDEITELPTAMQAKLLSVIEDHTVRRLGADRWHKTDRACQIFCVRGIS